MKGDGSSKRRLIGGDVCSPRWSPDGTEIAFARRGRGIYIADARGTVAPRLVFAGDVADLDWSPDGRRIAFEWRKPPPLRSEVFTVGIDGFGLARLAGGGWSDRQPAWSPAGGLVAFVTDRERWRDCRRCQALCFIEPDRRGFRRATSKGIHARSPAWSPDGRTIAWIRSVGVRAVGTLVIMTPAGRRLRHMSSGADDPTWAANGRSIVYAKGGSLWKIGLDGRGRERLTSGLADANPDWRTTTRRSDWR